MPVTVHCLPPHSPVTVRTSAPRVRWAPAPPARTLEHWRQVRQCRLGVSGPCSRLPLQLRCCRLQQAPRARSASWRPPGYRQPWTLRTHSERSQARLSHHAQSPTTRSYPCGSAWPGPAPPLSAASAVLGASCLWQGLTSGSRCASHVAPRKPAGGSHHLGTEPHHCFPLCCAGAAALVTPLALPMHSTRPLQPAPRMSEEPRRHHSGHRSASTPAGRLENCG